MKIGIDLGGSHIGVGLINETNQIIVKKEHNWNAEEKLKLFESAEKYSKKFIQEIIQENKEDTIEKIGIGYPYRNIQKGILWIEGKPYDLPNKLEEKFHVPVYLKNDVKCSAICEKTIGSLKKYDNCLFMTLGTGIGGAYFYHNELVVPNTYQGFEVGHMVIEANGRQCKCGRKGCFEQYASMNAFRKEIAEVLGSQDLSSKQIVGFLENNKHLPGVESIIEKYIDYLSLGICNLIYLLEPDAICIGGSFVHFAPFLMEKLKEKVQVSLKDRTIPDLLVAKYGNDAGMIGASMLESN